MNQIKFPFYARLAFILISIVLIVYLLYVAQSVLIPLFFAVMISFLLYPLARRLEQRAHMSRSTAAFVSISAFVACLSFLIYIITIQIIRFSHDIPLLQKNMNNWMQGVQNWIAKEYQLDSTEQVTYLGSTINNMLESAAMSFGGIFLQVSGIIFWIIIVFIYSYFILHHRRLILRFLLAVFPERHKHKVHTVVMETRGVTNGYLIGLLIEFVIVAIANSVTLWLLGVQYSILLGLMAAVLNFIPYLGIIIGAALVFLVTMVHGTPQLALQAAALLFVIHVLDANILFPKVVGDKVKMNALITIVSVLIGGVLWGVAGMFLSIPVSAMLKIIFEHVTELKPWALLMGVEDNKQIV
ncbi:MAG: AI-2E family transporter [Sphingobacteriales bacterium]|nr:MAG: AI-2E family transporter [Sphingobacteriales bacterium]